ncbi:MAG TPA: hypothetical protein VG268_08610 [Streptosporangiaceae bacterium]|nr:hypothetical protein [Streptosporangiaceae bacterium]
MARSGTFGLERGQSLEGRETRKRRAASFTPRLIFDPAIRAGSAAGRKRAAAGELARDAARASRERAARHRAEVATRVASEQGYPTMEAQRRPGARRAGGGHPRRGQRAGLRG